MNLNNMSSNNSVTIGIPSYSRPNDLDQLLNSIYQLQVYPDEILIVDDNSPDKNLIIAVVENWMPKFQDKNIVFKLVINDVNLGYDKNLRNIINYATSKFVTFIGNDDLFLPNGISIIKNYLDRNSNVKLCSRTFLRFSDAGKSLKIVGTSRLADCNKVFYPQIDNPRIYFRSTAFFGGLTFNREWAKKHENNIFDGTLYYQVYLGACAFYEGGIGYINEPIVGARIGGIPLFGNAGVEVGSYIPGSYTPEARALMWKNIIEISKFIDNKYSSSSSLDIKHELKVRMSFHVFESYTNRPLKDLFKLIKELKDLNLIFHPVPIALALSIIIFRKNSKFLFQFSRFIYQK